MNARLLLWVGLAGGLGSVLRFVLAATLHRRLGEDGFPAGTLAVNVVGSLAIGAIMAIYAARNALDAEARLALTSGLIGGFTTYSAFAYETLALVETHAYSRAAAYVGLTLVLCLGGCALGGLIGRSLVA